MLTFYSMATHMQLISIQVERWESFPDAYLLFLIFKVKYVCVVKYLFLPGDKGGVPCRLVALVLPYTARSQEIQPKHIVCVHENTMKPHPIDKYNDVGIQSNHLPSTSTMMVSSPVQPNCHRRRPLCVGFAYYL